MSGTYERTELTVQSAEQLDAIYSALLELSMCPVPAVSAAVRAALAHVAQAMNSSGLRYDLYSNRWTD